MTAMGGNERSASGFTIECGGKEIDKTKLVSFTAHLDLGQPDTCSVKLRNEGNELSNSVSLGAELVVKAEGSDVPIFKGEVAMLHPVYHANGNNVVVVQGVNVLHRMTRSQRSRTFQQQTDADMVQEIVRNYKLDAKCGDLAKQMRHEHVYQHNQTDLAFLRLRAARLGYDLWVECTSGGKEILHFDSPDTSADTGVKLRYSDARSAVGANDAAGGDTLFLKRFSPRLSSVGVVQEVVVQGWDPTKKEMIEARFQGKADAPKSPLGGTSGFQALTAGFSNMEALSFEVDQPVHSIEEAKAIAESKFRAAAMGYIEGDGECRGSPDIRPGVMVDIQVNPDGKDRFNGKYMITGATHRYMPIHSKAGGYITDIRVRRDAEG